MARYMLIRTDRMVKVKQGSQLLVGVAFESQSVRSLFPADKDEIEVEGHLKEGTLVVESVING